MLKEYYLNEDIRLTKLPFRYSDNLAGKIEDIIFCNRFEKENLVLWIDNLIGLVSWLSNYVIAWDSHNAFTHFDNGEIFIDNYGILFKF